MSDENTLLLRWITGECTCCPLHNPTSGYCQKFGCDIDCEQGVRNELQYKYDHPKAEIP